MCSFNKLTFTLPTISSKDLKVEECLQGNSEVFCLNTQQQVVNVQTVVINNHSDVSPHSRHTYGVAQGAG